jgi:hypothetical protein
MGIVDHTHYFLAVIRIPNSVVIDHEIALFPSSLHDFRIFFLVYHVVHVVICVVIIQAI